MVGIVTGTGLGLERSSGWVLGSRGQLGSAAFGRYGENVYINAATGNLLIDRTDEFLIGQGPDDAIGRNYNSLGNGTDDNGDNWRLNAQRQVTGLTGTVNTAGSTVTRIDWDGSDTLYTWDASRSAYVSMQGAGSYDTLTFASNVWTWTDGNSRVVESYDHLNGGRITSSQDADHNTLTYSYTGSLLTRVTTASGERTDLTWSGNNLIQLVTTKADTTTLTRVRYTYDGSNRLSTVTTDLSPDDNSIADGNVVVTTYTYDGASNRVASISQTGGAKLEFTYTLVNSIYRVTSMTQTVASGATETTSFNYNVAYNVTTVTDPLGQVTELTYDANGQLCWIVLPPAQPGAAAQYIQYTYNGNGDVLTATDASGNTITYAYDANGNLTSQRDPLGNTITRTYGSKNELLTETRYLVPDPDGAGVGLASQPVTARYAYDGEGHLRFAVSAEGGVTEFVYNAAGQQTSSITYRDDAYNVSALAPTASLSETTLSTWAAALTDRSTVGRVDTTYDFRGNVSTVTTYSAATTAGVGLTSSTYTRVTYTYDQFGNLLTRQTSGITNGEVFIYDGLGRLTSSVDLNAATTTLAFNDGTNTQTVTLANGLAKTSIYNYAGELISTAESGTGNTTATATYKYDNLGRLRMATDPMGVQSYYLYDAVGRKVVDIAADGSITEYTYDASNRLVSTISYANKLSAPQLATLVDGSGNPANIALSSVRPTSNAADQWSWRVYDQANRLIEIIDGKGDATVFAYDGNSNLVSTTSYANVIASGTITGFKMTAPTALQLPTANAAKDNVTRTFYDKDGLLIGALDGDGYLSQIIYNAAGQKLEAVSFVTATTAGLRASGTFAQLLTSVGTSAKDIHTRYFYDDRGLLRYTLDAALHPVEYIYDAAGNLINRIDYAGSVTATSTYTLSYLASQTGSAPLSTNADNRQDWSVYDAAGRLAFAIDANGEVTGYSYNAVGQLVKQLRYASVRATTTAPTLGDMTTWAAGQASNADNRISRKVYDVAGRVAYGVDPEGYVTEYRYNTDGQVSLQVRYAAVYTVTDSVTQASLATLIGGPIPSSAVQSSFSYDAVGRLSDSYDGEGVQTHLVYDALGRVTDSTVAYGTGDASTTHYAYDAAGRVASQTRAYGQTEASTTSFTYDGLGNVLTKVDGDGYTTSYTYDGLGQVLTVSVPIGATPANNAVTTNLYDAFGNVLQTTDARGNAAYYFYDTLGRLTLQIDREGYATANAYGIDGALLTTTHYVTMVTGTITPGTTPSITINAADATTTFTRDKLDRVIQVADAEGNYEQYTLNAFGDRTSVRNMLGGTTTNVFDKRSLLVSETLPMTSVKADGTTQASSVTNTFQYDARGNRTRMIEASGLIEQRTTLYTYDLTDRLVTTSHDTVQVVDTDLKTTSNVTPTETITYDQRGNVIQTEDASGAKTFFYYDHLDRRIASINALGTFATWTYDANGNVVSARIYGDAIALPGSAGGTPPANASTNYRETLYTYNRKNELLTTTVAGLRAGEYNGSAYTTSVGSIAVTNTYDKNGNVVSQTDGRGNSVWFYYDKNGRKVAQIDQELYLTYYLLDADGNVLREERFANKLPIIPTEASDPNTLWAYAHGGANDRITFFYL